MATQQVVINICMVIFLGEISMLECKFRRIAFHDAQLVEMIAVRSNRHRTKHQWGFVSRLMLGCVDGFVEVLLAAKYCITQTLKFYISASFKKYCFSNFKISFCGCGKYSCWFSWAKAPLCSDRSRFSLYLELYTGKTVMCRFYRNL